MKQTKIAMKALSAAVVAVLVTACGSGGTSKSSNNQTSAPPTHSPVDNNLQQVTLTQDNFTDVASQSLKSLLLNEAGTNALNKSIVITTDRVNPFAQDSVTGIVLTIAPFPCSNAGTIKGTLSLNNAGGGLTLDPSQDVVGTLNAEFDSCDHGGFGLDGDINGTLDGNVSKNNFASNLNVNNLTVEQPNFPKFVFDGVFTYNAVSEDFVSVHIDIASRSSVYFADDAYQQFDLTMSKVVNNTTGDYSYQIASDFTDSMHPEAYVSYQTLQPLTGNGFSLPTGGQLAVQGSNGTVYVYPQNEGKLLLELDLDDDGTIDDVTESTWEELVLSSLRTQ
jgi:hypothetical protein